MSRSDQPPEATGGGSGDMPRGSGETFRPPAKSEQRPEAHEEVPSNNPYPPKKAIGWDRWIELGFTGAILIATVVNVCVANWQWAAMNETNQISTRPYIKIDLLPDTFAIGSVDQRGGTVMSIQFTIENTGKLPAPAKIVASIDWQAGNHQFNSKMLRSYERMGERFIFPNQKSGSFTSFTNRLSDGELVDLKAAPGRRLKIAALVYYGPDPRHPDARQTQVCTIFLINDAMKLGEGEPCADEDSNRAW